VISWQIEQNNIQLEYHSQLIYGICIFDDIWLFLELRYGEVTLCTHCFIWIRQASCDVIFHHSRLKPRWTDFFTKVDVLGISPRRNHICTISYHTVGGFDFVRGRILPFPIENHDRH